MDIHLYIYLFILKVESIIWYSANIGLSIRKSTFLIEGRFCCGSISDFQVDLTDDLSMKLVMGTIRLEPGTSRSAARRPNLCPTKTWIEDLWLCCLVHRELACNKCVYILLIIYIIKYISFIIYYYRVLFFRLKFSHTQQRKHCVE